MKVFCEGEANMDQTLRFDEVLDAVDKFSLEDQETLLEILHRRRIARRRAELAQDCHEARREFQSGSAQPRPPTELIAEILS